MVGTGDGGRQDRAREGKTGDSGRRAADSVAQARDGGRKGMGSSARVAIIRGVEYTELDFRGLGEDGAKDGF